MHFAVFIGASVTNSKIPAPRPKPTPQPTFQSRDRDRLNPGRPFEHRRDDRVVEASQPAHFAETAALDSRGEVRSDDAHDLGLEVLAPFRRPVGTEGARRIAPRSGHEETVAESAGESPESAGESSELEVRSTRRGGNYRHTDGEVAAFVRMYTPQIDPEVWARIGDFCTQVVLDAAPSHSASASRWIQAVGALTEWCTESAGMNLDRERILDPNTIERYTRSRTELSKTSRATLRSVLLHISMRILGERPAPFTYSTYGRSRGSAPYSEEELAAVRSFVDGEPTANRRANLLGLVALAGGAGLNPGEVLAVKAQHIEHRSEGWLVRVQGVNARTVPFLSDFDDLIARSLEQRPAGYLVLPGRTTRTSKTLHQAVDASTGQGLRPSAQRLRSTWLVTMLDARVPFPLLLAAAGLKTLGSLDRYLTYADHQDAANMWTLRNPERAPK